MSATASAPNRLSQLVNRLLAIKPLADWVKHRARTMMIKRAEAIGVPWREQVRQLQTRGTGLPLAPVWETERAAIQNPDVVYPSYYTRSFHAYAEGNLGWLPAMEVAVAAQAVHARIWPESGAAGDARLRASYHAILQAELPIAPTAIADLGCGVGMSTATLQATFPTAKATGVDLSPYFLAVAQHCNAASGQPLTWHHAAAEATGLPAGSFDLVSACLMFHELPQTAAIAILQEARRLLRPGGYLAVMDMNPHSETLLKMPPFVFTLLKSTEPYLDEYLTLDWPQAMATAGFAPPQVFINSPRHHTLIARAIAPAASS